MRREERRPMPLRTELFSEDRKEERKSMSCLLTGNGPNRQAHLGGSKSSRSEREAPNRRCLLRAPLRRGFSGEKIQLQVPPDPVWGLCGRQPMAVSHINVSLVPRPPLCPSFSSSLPFSLKSNEENVLRRGLTNNKKHYAVPRGTLSRTQDTPRQTR